MYLSADYWNKRYLNDDFGWDAGAITTPLKNYFDQLRDISKRILIPGAGNAYEAAYLWEKGFKNTFVLDFAPEPLQNFKKRCPDFPESQLIQDDFFKHKSRYDLIVEQTFFCALDPALRPAYARRMHELLKPHGKLVGLLFNDTLNADKPPFGGSKAEYEQYFKPYFSLDVFETCTNSIKPREGRELFIRFIRQSA
ncbi:MAG: methyltransferase domain-containing protein [Bacteroidia bacterium]